MTASSVKLSVKSSDRSCFHSTFILGLILLRLLLRKSKILIIVVHFHFFELVYITIFGWKLDSSSIRSFAYWRSKNPTMIHSLCSIGSLASSTSYKALFTWSSFLKFTIDSRMCLFVAVVFFHSVSASFHDLVTVGAIGEELHWFCDDTWVQILVILFSCVHCWLKKIGVYSTKRCILYLVQTRPNCG